MAPKRLQDATQPLPKVVEKTKKIRETIEMEKRITTGYALEVKSISR